MVLIGTGLLQGCDPAYASPEIPPIPKPGVTQVLTPYPNQKPTNLSYPPTALPTRTGQRGRAKWLKPPVMIVHQNARPSVPGSSLTPDQGGGRTRKRAEGAKNLRYRIGCQNRKLTIATLNTRTLSKTQKLQELEEELSHIKWDILGISEHKRTDEEQLTLHSGNLLHYRGGKHINEGGVGFLIHKKHIQNVTKIHSISNRVMYLIYRLNTRYSLKIVQVYAPTSAHSDAEVEIFYDDINTAIQQEPTHYSMLIGDFNAKLGHKEDETETSLGTHGFGERNERGQTLLEFLLQQNLFAMNSFYRKTPQRKWTWASPDGSTKNEIDFIISNRKEIVRDVTVLNKFSIGSDHRLVRSKISINIKNERRKLIKQPTSSKWRPLRDETQYQHRIKSHLAHMENVLDPNIEDLSALITNSIKTAVKECQTQSTQRNEKLSTSTKQLMEGRRNLINKHTTNVAELRRLNREISKAVRRDTRTYNTNEILKVIEQNKGMKSLRKPFSEGRKNICKLAKQNGQITTNKMEILKVVEDFYATLYSDKNAVSLNTNIERVQNQGSEDIPNITLNEIRGALRDMKNNKAVGDDSVAVESLKAGGTTLLNALRKLFDGCLQTGTTPSQWDRAIIIILHKKGDITNLQNYRPISLLSHIYKLFMRIICKRLTNKFDLYQPREQAGFRAGFGTNDHLQVVKSLIEKCIEYNKPLCIIFVDYEKAFDTVDQHKMLQALAECRIDHRYTEVIKHVYQRAKACVRLQDDSQDFDIARGVRQGDVISPKLFTTLLEYMFKQANFDDMGINIDGEKLNHLRFADDILIIADSMHEAKQMLQRLGEASNAVGLKINTNKTQYMTNLVMSEAIKIDGISIEQVGSYKYLGHEISIGRDNQTREISRRIGLTWAAFGRLRNIFKSDIPMCLKRKVFDQCVLPVLTYGAETLTLTKNTTNRISIAQRKMERSMLGISLRDRIPNTTLRERSGVKDAVACIATLKWNWAGHVARLSDNRWTKRILEWRPRQDAYRSRGRPPTRWTDDIKKIRSNWMEAAQDRQGWMKLRETYVQQWTRLVD